MTVGATLRFSIPSLKSALNIKKICKSFFSIHQRCKTQFLMAITLLLWSMAAGLHLINTFGKEKDNIFEWIVEILAAFMFATGFGWHLHKFLILRKNEKRGKQYPSVEEFGTSNL